MKELTHQERSVRVREAMTRCYLTGALPSRDLLAENARLHAEQALAYNLNADFTGAGLVRTAQHPARTDAYYKGEAGRLQKSGHADLGAIAEMAAAIARAGLATRLHTFNIAAGLTVMGGMLHTVEQPRRAHTAPVLSKSAQEGMVLTA